MHRLALALAASALVTTACEGNVTPTPEETNFLGYVEEYYPQVTASDDEIVLAVREGCANLTDDQSAFVEADRLGVALGFAEADLERYNLLYAAAQFLCPEHEEAFTSDAPALLTVKN